MIDDEAGTLIKLDLSRLPEVTVFPGQVSAELPNNTVSYFIFQVSRLFRLIRKR